MKKLFMVTVSRTSSVDFLVYAEDEAEADEIADDHAEDELSNQREHDIEVDVDREVDRFWDATTRPDPLERIKVNRTALPRAMEKDVPYGDQSDLGTHEETGDVTAREILERLIAERVEREARAAEEAKQGKLFGGGA